MYRRDIYEQDKKAPVYPDRSNRIVLSIADSFKFCYRFFDMADIPNNLNLANINLCIKYFIKGRSEFYLVKKNGTDLLNCILIEDQKLLKAIIEHHKLGEGDLFAEFNLLWNDFEFATEISISQYVADTGVTLVNPLRIQELKLNQPSINNSWIGFDETNGDVYGINIPEDAIDKGIDQSEVVYATIKS